MAVIGLTLACLRLKLTMSPHSMGPAGSGEDSGEDGDGESGAASARTSKALSLIHISEPTRLALI
eukprot:1421527-Alexandrium_andersonii.AAC.1